MQLGVPKYKHGEWIHFLKNAGGTEISKGNIKNISITIRDDGSSAVYYHVASNDPHKVLLVEEMQIIRSDTAGYATPFYSIGDYVSYETELANKTAAEIDGIIESIHVSYYKDGTHDIFYVMEQYPGEYVNEDEVTGFYRHMEDVGGSDA